MRRPLAPVLNWPWLAFASLAAALAICRLSVAPQWWWVLAGVPFLLVLPRRLRATGLAGLLLLGWFLGCHQGLLAGRLALADHGRTAHLTGKVVGVPKVSGRVTRFAFRTAESTPRTLRLSWYDDAPNIRPGQCWQLDLRLRAPHGSRNPGTFDYGQWLYRQRIAALGSVRAGRSCGQQPSLDGLRLRLADGLPRIESRVRATFEALTLGLRRGLNDDDWEVLRRTGTSHLFAISGLHVGLIAAWGCWLGAWLWRRGCRWWGGRQVVWSALVGALTATLFAGLSGLGIPAQRALAMALLAMLLLATGRWRSRLQILSVAVVLVLVLDPLAVMAPGFWLSFTAVALIMLWTWWHPARSLWRSLLEIQLLLGLGLLPLSLYFFGGASLVALPVNLLLVPAFSLLLPVLLLSGLLHALGWSQPLHWQADLWSGIWRLLDWSAQWTPGYWQGGQIPLLVLLVGTLGMLLLLAPRAFGMRIPALVCMLPLLVWRPEPPTDGEFRVWFWDVGQGASVLVQTRRHALLYDAGAAFPGGFDAGASIIVPALRSQGLTRLDRLMISHGDIDHAGGAPAIQRAFPNAARLGAGGAPCRAGQQWDWDGVRFAVLHPAGRAWNDNNGSCVLRIDNGRRAVLLSGDIESAAETALLARAGGHLSAAGLLVPHHGSNSSSTRAFIEAVSPAWAVVSAGFGNRWGFPRPAVLSRYARADVPVWVTGQHGALRFDSTGDSGPVPVMAARPRIWSPPSLDATIPYHARHD